LKALPAASTETETETGVNNGPTEGLKGDGDTQEPPTIVDASDGAGVVSSRRERRPVQGLRALANRIQSMNGRTLEKRTLGGQSAEVRDAHVDKHGRYSAAAKAEARYVRASVKQARAALVELRAGPLS